MDEQVVAAIHDRYTRVAGTLDERARRLVAATEALSLGRGGIAAVRRATGLSGKAIGKGIAELHGGPSARPGRIRRAGGGRKKTVAKDPSVLADLERLVEPTTRGDPEGPLRWTCKSLRTLAAELGALGHQVSHEWVAQALSGLQYSLQGNRKTREGDGHPDRDDQFDHINQTAAAFLAAGEPGDLGGRQEEGTGGGLQERGARVAAQGAWCILWPVAVKGKCGRLSTGTQLISPSPWRLPWMHRTRYSSPSSTPSLMSGISRLAGGWCAAGPASNPAAATVRC